MEKKCRTSGIKFEQCKSSMHVTKESRTIYANCDTRYRIRQIVQQSSTHETQIDVDYYLHLNGKRRKNMWQNTDRPYRHGSRIGSRRHFPDSGRRAINPAELRCDVLTDPHHRSPPSCSSSVQIAPPLWNRPNHHRMCWGAGSLSGWILPDSPPLSPF